jgi:hypothetical protein
VSDINAYKANQRALDIWVGEAHDTPQGNYLVMNLNSEIKFQNFIMESVVADVNDRPIQNLEHIRAFYTQEEIQKPYPHFPRSANFIGTSSMTSPNISLIISSGP